MFGLEGTGSCSRRGVTSAWRAGGVGFVRCALSGGPSESRLSIAFGTFGTPGRTADEGADAVWPRTSREPLFGAFGLLATCVWGLRADIMRVYESKALARCSRFGHALFFHAVKRVDRETPGFLSLPMAVTRLASHCSDQAKRVVGDRSSIGHVTFTPRTRLRSFRD